MHDSTVHVVVCAYDEAASIGDLIERISSAAPGWGRRCRVVLVDDGSHDETSHRAEEASARTALPLELRRHEVNRGLGRALASGIGAALDAVGPDDVVVTMDADLTHDPEDVGALLAAIGQGADVAIASRRVPGSLVEGVPLYRRGLTRAAHAHVAARAGVPGVRDCTSGFRAYRAAVLTQAAECWGEDLIVESGFGCQLEVLEKLPEGTTFTEVPFTLHYGRKRRPSALRVGPAVASYLRVIAAARR